MTEQEFQRQVWRMYDQITTANGVKGKVLNVCFTTKSVRAFISGAPEWVRCELIETHTTGKGGDADDAAIIEELHNKVLRADERIKKLENERAALQEKISKNYLGDLLCSVNMIKDGIAEKKSKLEKIEQGLNRLNLIVQTVGKD